MFVHVFQLYEYEVEVGAGLVKDKGAASPTGGVFFGGQRVNNGTENEMCRTREAVGIKF